MKTPPTSHANLARLHSVLQIRQVSAQVHDIRSRVKHLVQLLQGKGFDIEVYQEPRFAACNLHMVYAVRPS